MNAKKPKPPFKPELVEADTSDMDDEKHTTTNASGRIKFDERGNAVWEWAMATGAFGRDVAEVSTSARMRKMEVSGLSIADDGPPPTEKAKINKIGVKTGYDPYESGKLVKDQGPGKKKDLRKLSEWIKLQKQAEANKKTQDSEE